jgi:hypothetical protein
LQTTLPRADSVFGKKNKPGATYFRKERQRPMDSIKTILPQLNRQFLKGAKIPHGMSNPVLCKYNGRYVIATFFYTYNKGHLDANRLPRPTHWMAAELESGNLIKEISCHEIDFSKQPYGELYSMEKPDSEKPGQEYFDALFKLFDEVREDLVKSGVLDAGKYGEYLDKMLTVVPRSYHVFYHELSEVEQA